MGHNNHVALEDSYRVVTVRDAPWGTYPHQPLVVLNGWSHSTTSDGTTQTVHCRRWEGGLPREHHDELHGKEYPYPSNEPRKRAYEAGVLGYFIRTTDIWGNPIEQPEPQNVEGQ